MNMNETYYTTIELEILESTFNYYTLIVNCTTVGCTLYDC